MKRESDFLKEGIQRCEGRIAALTYEVLAQGVVQKEKITMAEAQSTINRLAKRVVLYLRTVLEKERRHKRAKDRRKIDKFC